MNVGDGATTMSGVRRLHSPRFRFGLMAVLAAVVGLSACATEDRSLPMEERWFSEDSPFNTPISDPRLHPNSEAMVAQVVRDGGGQAKLYEYGYPVVHADDSTPRYRLTCSRYGGACPVGEIEVPIPDHARPNDGVDAALVVIDGDTSYDLFQLELDDLTIGWGSISDLRGTGIGTGGSGSGIARLAGLVTTEEVRRRRIDHALAVSVRETCADRFVWPATKTDGWSSGPDCIPIGTHLQLDPAVSLSDFELSDAEMMVGQALQRYGAYVVDSGHSNLAINFEKSDDLSLNERRGLQWDYQTLRSLPWESLRVLEPPPGR